MKTTKIDKAGHWLRADAAASFARMVDAGMPLGGVAAAGRSWAQQAALYAAYRSGLGNLAARPGTSLHESGIALDMTRGTPAQRWMTVGGDPFKVTPTGSIRANEYGWSRTVPSEPWHFSYSPSKDKHREATTVSSQVKTFALLLGVANCQSYDGDRRASAWLARGRLMAAQGRNVWVVTETSEAGRTAILAALGASWKVWTLNGLSVAVLFDSNVWQWRPIRKAGPWSPFGHGSLAVPLIHRATRRGVDVIAHHTRPKSIATDAVKDSDIALGAALAGRWPAVIAGDFARNAPKLTGWTRATPNVDTMDADGDQRVDAAFIRGGLTASNGRVVDPGTLSDHKWLTVDLTFGADPTL